jgi:hypothetical protein
MLAGGLLTGAASIAARSRCACCSDPPRVLGPPERYRTEKSDSERKASKPAGTLVPEAPLGHFLPRECRICRHRRAAFPVRLHRESGADKWVERVVRERAERKETAFLGAKKKRLSPEVGRWSLDPTETCPVPIHVQGAAPSQRWSGARPMNVAGCSSGAVLRPGFQIGWLDQPQVQPQQRVGGDA